MYHIPNVALVLKLQMKRMKINCVKSFMMIDLLVLSHQEEYYINWDLNVREIKVILLKNNLIKQWVIMLKDSGEDGPM
jgi:hypothetical protein